jgi:hypothetical protein
LTVSQLIARAMLAIVTFLPGVKIIRSLSSKSM